MDGLNQVDIESLENSLLISVSNPTANEVILEILSKDSDKRDHYYLNITNVIKVYYQRFESSVQREGFHNIKRIKLNEGNSEWINHFNNWQSSFNNETGFELLLYNGSILRFIGENISFEKKFLEDLQTPQDLESIPDRVQETTAKIVSNTSFIKKQVREEVKEIETSEKPIESIQDEGILSEPTFNQVELVEVSSDQVEEIDNTNEMDVVEDSTNEELSIAEDLQTEIPNEEHELLIVEEEIITEMEKVDDTVNEEPSIVEDVQTEIIPKEVMELYDEEEKVEIKTEIDIVEDISKNELPIVEDVQPETPVEMKELNDREEEIIQVTLMPSSSEITAITHGSNNEEDLAKFKEAIVTEETVKIQSEDETSHLESKKSTNDKPKDLLAQITEGENEAGSTDENSLEEIKNESDILKVDGVTKVNRKSLLSLRYDTIEKLANAKIGQLVKINGIGKATARKIITSANELISR